MDVMNRLFFKVSLLVVGILVVCFLPSVAHAIDGARGAPVSFKYAGGEAPKWVTDIEQPPVNGNYSVTWQYPIFQDARIQNLRELNSWARSISIEALFLADSEESSKVLAMDDSGILSMIATSKEIREAVGTQSELIPTRIFGNYLFFRIYTAWLGGTRPQHDVKAIAFDYNAGKPVSLQSFFKIDAERKLATMLRNAIHKEFEIGKRAYALCLKNKSRNSAVLCERQLNDEHIDACINRRAFEWQFVTVESSRMVTIDFPYDPGWRSTCGDESYVLEGKSIEKLFISPDLFRKRFSPENLKP